MKKLLIAATALSSLVVFANGASAADPVDMTYDWSGLYIGLQGGYIAANYDYVGLNPAGGINATATPDFDGFIGGLHSGYNFQMSNNVVVGFESEINLVEAKSGFEDQLDAAGLNIAPNQTKGRLNWSSSSRVRLGFAADRFLPYVTGGLAFGGAKFFIDDIGGDHAIRDTMMGWTVGAGMQYAVTDDLSAGLEYRYTDYGSVTKAFPGFPGFRNKNSLETNQVTFGVSWKF